jgi:hypothetical protein
MTHAGAVSSEGKWARTKAAAAASCASERNDCVIRGAARMFCGVSSEAARRMP